LIGVFVGLTKEQAEKIARKVGLGDELEKTVDLLLRLYDLAIKKDALLIEVNPYAEDVNGGCKYYCRFYTPGQPCLTVTSECILDHKMGSFCIYKQLDYKHLMLWRMALSINSP